MNYSPSKLCMYFHYKRLQNGKLCEIMGSLSGRSRLCQRQPAEIQIPEKYSHRAGVNAGQYNILREFLKTRNSTDILREVSFRKPCKYGTTLLWKG